MKKLLHGVFHKPRTANPAFRAGSLLLSMVFLLTSASALTATELQLTGTPDKGNTLILTTSAKIMQITRTSGLESYTLWKDNKAFVTISRTPFNENNGLKGVLPPGKYSLKTLGGSVTIFLDTDYVPENITLWGRHNALVKPLRDGNVLVLCAPTAIVSAAYDGAEGMGIFMGQKRVLYFLSPHNLSNPGPKVIGGVGGKTLAGQVLLPGVYSLVPGRGTADGIVNGQVVLDVR